MHDGRAVHVRFGSQGHLVDAVIPAELEEGAPFSFGVATGGAHRVSSSAVTKFNDLLLASSRASSSNVRARPTRTALTHLLTIQALDGALQGASHREIAITLFGFHTVVRDWSADGELRARVRYLIRRGQRFASIDYRRLVGLEALKPGDSFGESESP